MWEQVEVPLICPNQSLWDLQHIHSLSKNVADFGYACVWLLFPLAGEKRA